MTQRTNVLWGLLLALLVATMIWMGWTNYKVSQRIEVMRNKQIVLGTDEQLTETVNTLEKDLNDRIAYETNVTVDPLDLTRTIQTRTFLASLGLRETLEQRGRMRLSCTVMGDSPSAIVKFMGRSYVLRSGDELNGFRVTGIEPARIILTKGGSRLVLVNEAAPEGELSEGKTSVQGSNF
ncbi:MAG: hypothetical protein H6506_05075 [Calditrichaeota bacterium]|nr:hypothetical protein [Calditrichota bacterium]MCB9392008.1 hypothetical protein [Calditrichota bacterium]